MKTRRSFEHLSEEEKRIEKVKIQKDYDDKNREKINARKKYCYLKNKDKIANDKKERIQEKYLLGNRIELDFVGSPTHEEICLLIRVQP